MSKSISPELKTHLQGPVRTLAICWRIELLDGSVMAFTTHDDPIVWDSVTYDPVGFTPTQFEASSDLSVDGMDVQGFIDSDHITEADIASGRFDKAQVYCFKINWADTSQGIIKLPRGWIGDIQRKDQLFVAEVRSLTQALQQTIGEQYVATCSAALGDSRCKINLPTFTVTGSVTSVSNFGQFIDSSRTEPAGWFNYGLLTFTSGLNISRSMEVKTFSGQTFQLFQTMPEAIVLGDTYTVYAGCDKQLSTCRDKFSNVLNIRAFPHIPGADTMNKVS